MRISPPRLVWALAGVFAVVIAWEAARPVAPAMAPLVANPAGRSAIPVSAEPVAVWTGTILARPLFAPDRRPAAPEAVAAVVADAPQSLPRLAGIIVSPGSRTAIFANGSDHSTVAGEGEKVGDWRVVSIHAEAVDLAGPDGARTVRPSYSTDPPPAATTAFVPGYTPGMPFSPPAGNVLPGFLGSGRPPPFNALPSPAGAAAPSNAPGAVPRIRP